MYGWVVGVAMNDPSHVMAWATAAAGGGAWSVGGLASDGVDPFVATGNTFGASTWGGGEAIIHLQSNLTLTGTENYWTPTNWIALDNGDTDIGGSGPLLVDVPGATPSKLVVALGKDGNAYLLNRTNLGGISLPIAQAQVAGGNIIQAAVTYRTALWAPTWFLPMPIIFMPCASARAIRRRSQTPGRCRRMDEARPLSPPRMAPTIWWCGASVPEGRPQRLHGFLDGDTGATVFTGRRRERIDGGVRDGSTPALRRADASTWPTTTKVYAFSVPGQTVTSIAMSNLKVLPGGAFQFSFTNISGANFNVFGTSDPSQPFTNWTWLGGVTEVSPGQFQFTDPQGSNQERFYRVSAP